MPGNQGKGGGQPTKYRVEYSTDEFLKGFNDYCKDGDYLVSLCRLAIYLSVCEETLAEWSRVHKKFSVTMDKIRQISKGMLMDGGLKQTYSSRMSQFCLSANHGMAEKTETVHGLDKATATLMGLVDGSSKGKLPDPKEAEDAIDRSG